MPQTHKRQPNARRRRCSRIISYDRRFCKGVLRYSVDLYKSDGCVFVAHTSDFSLYLKAKDVNLLSDPSGTYRRYSSYKKTTKIKNNINWRQILRRISSQRSYLSGKKRNIAAEHEGLELLMSELRVAQTTPKSLLRQKYFNTLLPVCQSRLR